MATEALSSINLLDAEGIVTFLLDTIKDHLTRRISERREPIVVGLILYLNKSPIATNSHFKTPLKSSVQKLAAEMLDRLFQDDTNEEQSTEAEQTLSVSNDTLHLRLCQAINNLKSSSSANLINDSIKKDFAYFDRCQQRTPRMELLLDALLSLQPTSTQSERNFSTSGAVVTKKRTRLTDENVDTLCFLKSYFIRIDRLILNAKNE